MLVYNGRYYLFDEGHKEFFAEKTSDEDYYLMTLAAIAKEFEPEGITDAEIVIAAGLPLTWMSRQKEAFAAYLSRNEEVSFQYNRKNYHIRIAGVKIYPQRESCVSCFSKQGICTADSPWTGHSSIHSLGDIRPLRPL